MNLQDYTAQGLDGREVRLGDHQGQVLLIVNTASRCGFTPQYRGLEALRRKYKDRGFEVLGFPCNQFGGQEPGDAGEIADFCRTTYDVSFPMFAKIDVNGRAAHPLYAYLTKARPGLFGSRAIKWNFTKFLVDRQDRAVRRYAPAARPKNIETAIERLL
jgi:glutathione peroxidase